MPTVVGTLCFVAGAILLAALLIYLTFARLLHRWRRGMDVCGADEYRASLDLLSAACVRRHFDPYVDIDWESTVFALDKAVDCWVLPQTDPLGGHHWYRSQPEGKQIEIGIWQQVNSAKISLQLENILIRGLMNYIFWVPNGSPEYRYCLHEAIEECNHALMFQELVNRIGVSTPGVPRWLRWISPAVPLYAGPLPAMFFFGVLAGELPLHVRQVNFLRGNWKPHPLIRTVMAIHVAEEARHIAFADQFLSRRVPQMSGPSRFILSLYVPIVMRVLGHVIAVPPRSFFRHFGIPRSVRRDLLFGCRESRRALRAMYGDVRMLCSNVGLMNPLASTLWRVCGIGGRASRYFGEPPRTYTCAPPTNRAAAFSPPRTDVPDHANDNAPT